MYSTFHSPQPDISYKVDNFNDPYLITHVTSERHFQGDFHIHNGFYELYLFLDGNGFLYNDGKKYSLSRGDFLLIAPGTIHRAYISNDSPYERIVLHLSEKSLTELSSPTTNLLRDCQLCSNHFYHLEANDLNHLLALIEPLLNHSCQSYGMDLLEHSYLTILLVKVFEKIKQFSSEVFSPLPPIIRETLDYLNLHLAEELSIQIIADALNVSRSYLSHQFRDYFNTSLWNYILSKRLVLAQNLLLEGKSVTEACYESGFRDYAHFIKTFSRTFGISPKKYCQNKENQNTFRLPS